MKGWVLMTIVIGALGLIFTGLAILFYNQKKDRRLLSIIPNFWTGLGVLGTFVTLFYYFGWKPIPNNLLTPEGLPVLMGKLAAAFSTSIIGIFFGLVSLFVIRIYFSNLDTKLHREKPYLLSDPNELLFQILQELITQRQGSNAHWNTQHEYLARIAENSDHFNAIRQMVEDFRSTSHEALEYFKEELADFKGKIYTELFQLNEQIREVLGEFGEELKVLLNDLDQYLKQALEQIGERVIRESEDISQQASREFQTSLEGLLNKMTASFDRYLQHLDTWAASHEESLGATRKESADNMIKFSKDVETQLAEMSASIQSHQTTLLDTIDQINTTYKDTLGDFVQQNLDDLKKVFELVKETQTNTRQVMGATLEKFKNSVKEYQATQLSNRELAQNLQHQSANLQAQNQKLNDLIIGLHRYDELIHNLSARGTDLQIIIDYLDQMSSKVNGQKV